MEAAADLIANPSHRHAVERAADDPLQILPRRHRGRAQQKLEGAVRRELWRAAESSVVAVVGLDQLLDRALGDRAAQRPRRDELASAFHLPERARQPVGRGLHLGAASGVGVRQGPEDRGESGPAAAIIGGKVGAAPEGLLVRREEDRHGPSARAGQELDGAHVDLVHVGALLPIHLDRDEVVVQELRDRVALEGLVLHHVAPVTGAVADREEDGLVLAARLREGFRTPGIPVDGVPLVLEQVGALLFRETIGFPLLDVRRPGHLG